MKIRELLKIVLVFLSFLLCGCVEGLRVQELSWSADGKFIAFVSNNRIGFIEGTPPYSLYPYTIDGVCSPEMTWSPLANKLVFVTSKKGVWDLILSDVDEKKDAFLTQDIAKDTHPRYLNGEELFFISDRGGTIAPWKMLLSSKQVVPYTEEPSPVAEMEGAVVGEVSLRKISKDAGTEVRGEWREKKIHWREPDLQLDLPRWAPGKTPRVAFRASNRAIQKDDFIVVVDFDEKKLAWVPLLPEHSLAFADFLAHRENWPAALEHDRYFLSRYPNDVRGSGAYLRQARYHLLVQPDLGRVQTALQTLLGKFPDDEKAGEARFLLALSYALQQNWAAAKSEFEKNSDEEARLYTSLLAQKNIDEATLQSLFQTSLERVKGPLKPARELNFWDEMVSLASFPEAKEQARYKTALTLEEKLNDPKKAAQIYWKVRDPYRQEALEKLFYLNRDQFFDFSTAAQIGSAWLREYPDRPLWDSFYDDVEELKGFLIQREEKAAMVSFYKGRELAEKKKAQAAVGEYEKAAAAAKTAMLRREALLAAGNLSSEALHQPSQAMEFYFAYLKTFETIPDKKAWDRVVDKMSQPALELLVKGPLEKVKSLCAEMLRSSPRNPYVPFVEALASMAAFRDENWAEAEKKARKFIADLPSFRARYEAKLEMEKKDLDSLNSTFVALTALACEQQQKWTEAESWYEKFSDPEWEEFVKQRREWIQKFSSDEGPLLKEFLRAANYFDNKLEWIQPDGKNKVRALLQSWFPKAKDSSLLPLGHLLLCDQIIREVGADSQKQEAAIAEMAALYQRGAAQFSPESEAAGKILLKLAALEEKAAFYVLALKHYGEVAHQFPTVEIGVEALWHQARLHFNPLNQNEEGRMILSQLVQERPESVWAPKALLELAREYAKNETTLPQAMEQYQILLKNYPDGESAQTVWRELGELYSERMKKYPEAVEAYERYLEQVRPDEETKEVRLRLELLKQGGKSWEAWLEAQKLDPQKQAEEGIKIYERLLKQVSDEEAWREIYQRYLSFLKSAKKEAQRVELYRRRIEKKMMRKDWDELFSDLKEIIEKKESRRDAARFLNELAGSKKISAQVLFQVQRGRARLFFYEEKYLDSKKILEKLLQDQPKDKELIKWYYRSLRAIPSQVPEVKKSEK